VNVVDVAVAGVERDAGGTNAAAEIGAHGPAESGVEMEVDQAHRGQGVAVPAGTLPLRLHLVGADRLTRRFGADIVAAT
jgi:hypothetical protein